MGIAGQQACLLKHNFQADSSKSTAHLVLVTVFSSNAHAEASKLFFIDYVSNKRTNWLNKDMVAAQWVSCQATFTNWR